MADVCGERLSAGIEQLGLPLTSRQIDQLMAYLDLLVRWNRAYNLTAIRNPEEMVIKHLLDSLAVAPLIQGSHVIDVGTGAGLPGIPLAIAFPEKHWALLDSNGKKTRFLFQVISSLRLVNATVIEARVETFQPERPFSAVISRAFASLDKMVSKCSHLVAENGVLYGMKSAAVGDELEALDSSVQVLAHQALSVPFLNDVRSLVTLQVKRSMALV